MLVGISGEIGSGKDTVGKIIQYLDYCDTYGIISYSSWEILDKTYCQSKWKIHKFAGALKDIICILTGCTREQLEDIDFKNSTLGDEWINYRIGINKFTSKENLIKRYEEEHNIKPSDYWINSQLCNLTYRELLQKLGTDLLRNQLHEDVWVNALFSKYKSIIKQGGFQRIVKDENGRVVGYQQEIEYPNWIITDVRFENEAKAIKDRGGIVIRIDRTINYNQDGAGIKEIIKRHSSETSLDNYLFDYIIDNNGTIDELINQVKEILVKENII